MNGGWGISNEIALSGTPLDLTDDKSTLVQIMAWCRQATSHYLSQCWPISMLPNGVTRPKWVNRSCIQNHIYWQLLYSVESKLPAMSSKGQGADSTSHKTSYRKIPQSLQGARSGVKMLVLLWNLAGISAAVLPRYLPNFRAIGKILTLNLCQIL